MTPPNTELAACPFCGSSDIHFHTVRICITCNSCEAEGPMANTEDEAWNLWRKRHLATLREDKGGDFKPLFEDVRKGLSNQSTGGEVAIAWSSLKRIEISLDAALTPSPAPVPDGVVEALEIAKKRIQFLGVIAGEKHDTSNDETFIPIIDKALQALKRGV